MCTGRRGNLVGEVDHLIGGEFGRIVANAPIVDIKILVNSELVSAALVCDVEFRAVAVHIHPPIISWLRMNPACEEALQMKKKQ